ncbi:hypothetical protein DKX38_019354 [Salix brachista]|uniref:Uncharacterized protein n=1 Tax=Salix brachista TaxID=2182728 RepID=A0A5N5KG09_9ROSI|nr:hypothetical protein DKX38_019354 [Salix brachista]
MAENDVNMQQQLARKEEERRLKYLQFVQVAAVHAVLTFTNLYIYAKDKAGPLKPGVETVEGTVKSVVGLVYDKFRDVPIEVLKFVDRYYDMASIVGEVDVDGRTWTLLVSKCCLVWNFIYLSMLSVLHYLQLSLVAFVDIVYALSEGDHQIVKIAQLQIRLVALKDLVFEDFKECYASVKMIGLVDESVTSLDSHVPPLVKQVSFQALSAAQNAPVAARAVASEVQRSGVKGTASELAKTVYAKYEPTAKELYSKYEPKAEQVAVSAWRKLNQLPLFPQVAQVVVPTAAFCSEKYNQTVASTAEKGYRVSSFLPLVPTEKIAKVFSEVPESTPLGSS